MGRYVIAYLVALAALGVLDLIWISQVAGPELRKAMGPAVLTEIRWVPALLFYAGYPIALLIFCVAPARSSLSAGWRGALFGYFAYATYDLSNLATLAQYTVELAAMDIAYGTVASSVCAVLAYLASMAWMSSGVRAEPDVPKELLRPINN